MPRFAVGRRTAVWTAALLLLGERDPALTEVLHGQIPFQLPLWIAMHEDLRRSPRCRVVFDALVKGMSAYIGRTGKAANARPTPDSAQG